ncbi:MAG TPA: DNA-directed RNA polymerase subunit alpha [Candidatus Paceibacterota bacterium]|nr:DNA-directed RNA polymerase subunit alpha [Candidatus Paceibacterota bacterium]
MADYNVLLPSKPRVVNENQFQGNFEIDGLYPGYGHTLGNSLRRIILSSLPGSAITSIKIDGVSHEFSTISGVKEDVINIILNLKKVRIQLLTDEPQTLTLKVKGAKKVTAADIKAPGQAQIMNTDQYLAEITDKNGEINMELSVEKGIGYISKEALQKEKVEIGTIALDAPFSPIKRVNYDVEQMRVGDRTDFNRLKMFIETDGTISPKEALEKSIEIMISQLKAIVGFKEEEEILITHSESMGETPAGETENKEDYDDLLKTRIESLDLSQRTINALIGGNIRTLGGLVKKKEKDILEIEGLGAKGLEEIKKILKDSSLSLKE